MPTDVPLSYKIVRGIYKITSVSLVFFLLATYIPISNFSPITKVDAAIYEFINIQGKITNDDGTNLVAGSSCVVAGASNDTCDFVVSLYDAASGGNLLWTQTLSNREIGEYDGVFSLDLDFTTGYQGGYNVSIFETNSLFLQVNFEGENFTTRSRFRAVPYAFYSDVSGETRALRDADGDTSVQVEESADEDKIRFDTAGTERVIIDTDGYVGIGIADPTELLDVNGNGIFGNHNASPSSGREVLLLNELVATDGLFNQTLYGLHDQLTLNPSGTATLGTADFYGGMFDAEIFEGNTRDFTTGTNDLIALQGQADYKGYTAISNVFGVVGAASNRSTNASAGDVTNAWGGSFIAQNWGPGHIENAYAIETEIRNTGGGTIANAAGIVIDNIDEGTNNTLALLGQVAIPTGNYGIYNSSNNASVFTGTFGSGSDLSISGIGTRMMWYPKKAAFRAGQASGVEWNDANIGNNSAAFGALTQASGFASTAFGYESLATGNYSTAFGTASQATGQYSVAWGGDEGAIASGELSTAWGSSTQASGNGSSAWGNNILAESYLSTAFGRFNVGGGTAGSWVATDKIFEIGIGAPPTTRANALTVLKNGQIGIGEATPTALLHIDPATTARSSLRLETSAGTNPSTPNSGDMWWNGTQLYFYNGSSSVNLLNSMAIGNAIGSSTPGSVLFVGASNDLQQDNSNFFFDNTNDRLVVGGNTSELGLTLLTDGGIMAKGTFGSGDTLTTTGAGTRMIWYPRKAAFRAGRVNGTEWDDANIANLSVAFGDRNTVNGTLATAFGQLNSVSGGYASVFGQGHITTSYQSFVVGQYSIGGGNDGSWVGTDSLLEVGNGTSSLSRSNAFTILKNGNTGVGTATPSGLLHVYAPSDASDTTKLQVGTGTYGFFLGNTTATGFAPRLVGASQDSNDGLSIVSSILSGSDTGTTPAITIDARRSTDAVLTTRPVLSIRNFTTNIMDVLANGNVGIGATTPGALLHIAQNSGDAGTVSMYIENTHNTASSLNEYTALEFLHNGGGGAKIIGGKEEDFTVAGNRTGYLSFEVRQDGTYNERMRINSRGEMILGTTTLTEVHTAFNTLNNTIIEIQGKGTDNANDEFASLILSRSRSAVSGNHAIGTLSFANTSLSGEKRLGQIAVIAASDTDTGDMYFSTMTNGTFDSRMIITGSGSVGIGTDLTPTGILQITSDEVRIGDAGTINVATGDGDLYVEDALEVDGHVRVGANTPGVATGSGELFVTGDLEADGNLDIAGTSTLTGIVTIPSSGAVTTPVSVCRNSSNQITTCSSSIRYKENVENINMGLDTVMALRPVTYDWKGASGDAAHDFGFIAEEVYEINPILTFNDNNTGQLEGVRYMQMTALTVKAIQEQQVEIDELRALIEGGNANLDSGLTGTDGTDTALESDPYSTVITYQREVYYEGDIVARRHVIFNEDTVGRAVILAGDTEVFVEFSEAYTYMPIVNLTPLSFVGTPYRVRDISEDGFYIEIQEVQTEDKVFNWSAFGAEEANVFVSNDTVADIYDYDITVHMGGETVVVWDSSQVGQDSTGTDSGSGATSPTPTPTPEVTPEPTVEITPTPTPEVTSEPISTPEPTPVATPEPTPEVTPEPSVAEIPPTDESGGWIVE